MGTTDRTKKLVNMLSELLLIMATYFFCGVIRAHLPYCRFFAYSDTLTFGYLAVLYAAAFVLINYLLGGYDSLKFAGMKKEVPRIVLCELLGCLVMTSVIYIFRLEQFSRLLLALTMVFSVGVLLVKRLVVSHLYMKYSQTKGHFNTLLVGAGAATARLAQSLLEDPEGVESAQGSLRGLELLPCRTVFAGKKTRTRIRARAEGPFAGARLEGYEIHMGVTEVRGAPFCRLEDGREDGCRSGNVFGTYLHGLFDSGELTEKLAAWLCARKNIPAEAAVPVSHRAYQERQYDLLAAELRKALDMEAHWQIVDGKGGDR